MKYTAEIDVMPHREILDPQGKAVGLGLRNLGIEGVESVRIGKHLTLHLEAADEEQARGKVEEACRKLLANAIMEGYTFTLTDEEPRVSSPEKQ